MSIVYRKRVYTANVSTSTYYIVHCLKKHHRKNRIALSFRLESKTISQKDSTSFRPSCKIFFQQSLHVRIWTLAVAFSANRVPKYKYFVVNLFTHFEIQLNVCALSIQFEIDI